MSRWLFAALAFVSLLPVAALGQCTLSANSGINSADTCVTMNLTVTSNTAANLPQPFYNPATQTTSNVLNVAPAAQTLYVEAGYDPNGGLVMNFWPTGNPVNPYTTDADAIGFIRFAGGQVIVFGQDGNPLPLVPPRWHISGMAVQSLGQQPQLFSTR